MKILFCSILFVLAPLAHSSTALVTGASAGIGRALAEKLSKEGCKVIAVARNFEKLSELARTFPGIEVRRCDLADSVERTNLLNSINEKIDYVIHNAGIESHIGEIESITESGLQEILQVNLVAPIILTAQLKQRGLLHKHSRILGISSRAGDQAFRGVAQYGVSKSGLDAFMRALVEEGYLAASAVPGEVDTQIQQHLREGDFPLKQFFIDAKNEDRLLPPSVSAAFLFYLLHDVQDEQFTGKKHNIYDERSWSKWLGKDGKLVTPAGERENNMKMRPLDLGT